MNRRLRALVLIAVCSAGTAAPLAPAAAQNGRIAVKSTAPRVAEALARAVSDGKMALVCHVRELDAVVKTIVDRGVAGR